MHSSAKIVDDYISSLPSEHALAIKKVRDAIVNNLPSGYQETMNWGMITYEIPLSTYPKTYNGQPLMFAALSSQKNHMSVYLMNIYADQKTAKWFKNEYLKTGKKYDVGKSCVRFKKLDDLPLPLIGKAVSLTSPKDYIKIYEKSRAK